MAKNKVENQGMIRRVYQRIILLGMLVHVLYIALGGWLTMTEMVFYNVGSTVFYLTMLVLVFYGRYRLAVALIHLEVCVFVVVGTHALGWETGLPLLLIAMASLIYICPYRHSTVPFLFSLLEIGVFALKLTSDQEIWLPQALPGSLVNGIYLFNAAMCFTIILVSSSIFNVSSALAQGRLRRKNKELQEAAFMDRLTGTLTRYGLQEQLRTSQGKWMAVALGDLDDFKQVNDTYGHICGDYVLATTARLMRETESALVCRWGGEEFLILMADLPQAEAERKLATLAEKIRSYPFSYDGHLIRVTMTFGLTYGRIGADFEAVVELADQRMYQGKRQGKDRIVF